MSARELITEHLDLWTGAVTKKSSSGRGSNGKVELTGVKRLRELILSLAVRGKLVPQNSEGPSAASLLVDIEAKKKELYHAKIVKKPKKLCQPQSDEAPWPLPSSWEWVKLPDIYYPISPSGKKLKSSETLDIGQFPVVDQGQSYISGYTDDASLVIEIPHPVIVFGDHTTARKYIDFSFVPGADGTKILCPILVNPRFFYLQLLGYDLENRGYARHFKVLNENFFALPPLEEQHRIVQKVDELMALCDRLEQQTSDQLEAHETLVDTLLSTLTQSESATELADNWARLAAHFDTLFTTEQSIDKLKQTILQLAVMGRLVEKDAEDEPAVDLLTQIHTRKVSLAGDRRIKQPRPLAQLDDAQYSYTAPAHWAWASFQDVADEISTGPFGSMIHKHDYVEGGIPLINPSHMANGKINEDSSVSVSPPKAEELSGYKLVKGDIVMARRGEVGRCAVVTDRESGWLCGTGSFVLRFHPAINRQFILLLFSTNTVREYLSGNSVGTTMTNLNHGILKKMPVALPPAKEQHRIVQKVDELMTLCDQLTERLNLASETRCQLAEAVVEGALT